MRREVTYITIDTLYEMLASGQSVSTIAEETGLSLPTVYQRMRESIDYDMHGHERVTCVKFAVVLARAIDRALMIKHSGIGNVVTEDEKDALTVTYPRFLSLHEQREGLKMQLDDPENSDRRAEIEVSILNVDKILIKMGNRPQTLGSTTEIRVLTRKMAAFIAKNLSYLEIGPYIPVAYETEFVNYMQENYKKWCRNGPDGVTERQRVILAAYEKMKDDAVGMSIGDVVQRIMFETGETKYGYIYNTLKNYTDIDRRVASVKDIVLTLYEMGFANEEITQQAGCSASYVYKLVGNGNGYEKKETKKSKILRLRASGMTVSQIAKELGAAYQYVYNTVHNEENEDEN